MKNPYYNKESAIRYAEKYGFLVGYPLPEPYQGCKIHSIEVRPLPDGTYDVILIHDVFKKPAIPEIFGFKNLEVPLIPYLEAKGIDGF